MVVFHNFLQVHEGVFVNVKPFHYPQHCLGIKDIPEIAWMPCFKIEDPRCTDCNSCEDAKVKMAPPEPLKETFVKEPDKSRAIGRNAAKNSFVIKARAHDRPKR
jgi:hypothetical protein